MTNKEILAELKRSYEYLRDIRENGSIDHCSGQMKDNLDKLDVQLTQEMFNCFEWYLNKYLEIYKGSGNNEKDSTL